MYTYINIDFVEKNIYEYEICPFGLCVHTITLLLSAHLIFAAQSPNIIRL